MSRHDDNPPPGAGDPHAENAAGDDVGTVAEEAMKLFGAFADLARQQGGDAAVGLGGLAGQVAAFTRDVNAHLATDDPECRYCPVCRVVHVVRETSPEVKAHLITAASSLLQAAAGLLETLPPADADGRGGAEGRPRTAGVEKIDLDDRDDPAAPGPDPFAPNDPSGPTDPYGPAGDDW